MGALMKIDPLLERPVDRFNHGVTTGDFQAFLDLFVDDAVMSFRGIPVGPFRGRESIGEAYREQPPDDTIRLLRVRYSEDEILAEFAWEREPARRGGDLVITRQGDRIAALTIIYGGADDRWS